MNGKKEPEIDENLEKNAEDLDEPGRRLTSMRIGACVKAAANIREWGRHCTVVRFVSG